jgi:hypothetical protein
MTVEAPAKRTDWRVPIHAVAEETYWYEVAEDGTEEARPAIRWHVSAEGLGRIQRMEACWDCLTGFPAPPRPDTWAVWKTSGFGWVHSLADSRKLVRNRQCPLCKAEITPEMLALQLDTEWTAEDHKLKAARDANLDDDRERFDHADQAMAKNLGLIEPVAPPSRRKSMKRRGES